MKPVSVYDLAHITYRLQQSADVSATIRFERCSQLVHHRRWQLETIPSIGGSKTKGVGGEDVCGGTPELSVLDHRDRVHGEGGERGKRAAEADAQEELLSACGSVA
mmetsp:Transcript_25513/g.70401  ORF Transcript_25513/g.70401 Transcript_25513/m.70401 type:complete len:106 (-) Transcript_25513:196-513(-)|eukprot:scaffold329187_cov53-Tisochrysis_lutea.AAC.1